MRNIEVIIDNFKVHTYIYSDISEDSMEKEIMQRLLSSRVARTEGAVKDMIRAIDENYYCERVVK